MPKDPNKIQGQNKDAQTAAQSESGDQAFAQHSESQNNVENGGRFTSSVRALQGALTTSERTEIERIISRFHAEFDKVTDPAAQYQLLERYKAALPVSLRATFLAMLAASEPRRDR